MNFQNVLQPPCQAGTDSTSYTEYTVLSFPSNVLHTEKTQLDAGAATLCAVDDLHGYVNPANHCNFQKVSLANKKNHFGIQS